jgi:hypothetical protein
VDWRRDLPREWAGQVVSPTLFSRFREYEMLAERVVGYEVDDEPCYCAHYFVLNTLRSDDDDEFYLVPGYWERLVAWRLIDGRWLIFRCLSSNEDCAQSRSFFSFADEMPR